MNLALCLGMGWHKKGAGCCSLGIGGFTMPVIGMFVGTLFVERCWGYVSKSSFLFHLY